MWEKLRNLFSPRYHEAQFEQGLLRLRQQTPVPVFWLFGKTQSGKTSVVKFLTGAEDAEIGVGFRPCTRFSHRYQFPTAEAPLLTFLDTRGLDEPGYDPAEDLAQFDTQAHVLVVTVKALDHAQENVVKHLRALRRANPGRPALLVLTCLHEAYPQQQHPKPYPFDEDTAKTPVHEALARSLAEMRTTFNGLFDREAAIDLTRPEEGFTDPTYGGERLKTVLLEMLPAAYGQTLRTLTAATGTLQDLHARRVLPHILGYSVLAGTAGAVPIPYIDLLILPAIQTRMIFHLARLSGQPLSATRFLELASTLGLGVLMRQASREVVKFIPYLGSVAAGLFAGSSTLALGKAFCYYYQAVHQGHVPKPEDLRRYYQEQLELAQNAWSPRKT